MTLQTQEIELADWVLRVHEPSRPGAHPVIMLLHGWTGDEKVMWVFAGGLPEESWVFAPRGIFPTAQTLAAQIAAAACNAKGLRPGSGSAAEPAASAVPLSCHLTLPERR